MDTKLTVSILLLVLAGGVLVAYLWETLNQLLAGLVDLRRVLLSLPVLALFVLLLRFLSHAIERWHHRPEI